MTKVKHERVEHIVNLFANAERTLFARRRRSQELDFFKIEGATPIFEAPLLGTRDGRQISAPEPIRDRGQIWVYTGIYAPEGHAREIKIVPAAAPNWVL